VTVPHDRWANSSATADPPRADLLWPRYRTPDDVDAIEAVPLADRGLPPTTYAALLRAAQLWPHRPAASVLESGEHWQHPHTITFAELLADVHRYADLLHTLGVRRHSAVALMSPNTAELIPAVLAAQLAGIAVPVNPDLSAQHITELFRRGGVRALIAAGPDLSPDIWDTARTIAADLQLDALLALRPTGAATAPPGLPAVRGVQVGYLDQAATREPTVGAAAPEAADFAAFFHTGGTTGTPKLAAHTHAMEVADAWMIAANSTLGDDSVLFAALPLFHVNALVVTVLAPLLRGQQVIWAGPLGYRDPALITNFWRIVQHHRIAAMSAVPTVYGVLAQQPVVADISSLRMALVGAAPLPAAVRTAFEERTRITLTEGYGLTEATCASARTFIDSPRPGSVGQRLPYQLFKTVAVAEDGSWRDLPHGELGTLAIKGPTVFPGYVVRNEPGSAPQLDAMGKLVDGWLDTGDLARTDREGFLYLLGRAKDLIIRGGHNIDPAVIEDALLTHPDVTGAGAVGRPDAHAGEVPVAYVTVRAGAHSTGEAIRHWVSTRINERAAVPKAVLIVDALPLTAVGKPYKVALRADATLREIHDALTRAGLPLADDQLVCDPAAGALEVVVHPPADEDLRAAIADTLARYPLRWRFGHCEHQ
jgi:fatty-acyl-CoA synthase